jgi:hypothetical protein
VTYQAPQTGRLGAIQLGQQQVSIPESQLPVLKQIPIFSLPNYLSTQMQALSKKYNSMSIKDLLIFSFIQMSRIYHTPPIDTTNSFEAYHEDATIIKDVILNKINRTNLCTIKKFIRHLHSNGYPELVPVLCTISKYIEDELGKAEEIELSIQQQQSFSLPANSFNLSFLFGQSEMTTDIQSDVVLNACLLPSMLKDYEAILKNIIEESLESYNACIDQFRKFMGKFLPLIEKKGLSTLATLDYFTKKPEDDRMDQIINLLKTNQPINIEDPTLSPETKELIKSLLISTSPPIDEIINPIIQFTDATIPNRFKKLEAFYAVDIQAYTEMFSTTYGERLFKEINDTEGNEIVHQRIEELLELVEGIISINIQTYDLSNECINYSQFLLQYPSWYWGLGENCKPENLLHTFTHFRNFTIQRLGSPKAIKKHIKESLKAILMDYPQLKEDLHDFESSLEAFMNRTGALCRHTKAIQWQCSTIRERCRQLKDKILQERTELERKETELKAAKDKALRLANQLIKEEARTHYKPTKARKDNSASKPASRGLEKPKLESVMPIHSSASSSSSAVSSSSSSSSSSEEVTPASSTTIIDPTEKLFFNLTQGFEGIQFENIYAREAWNSAVNQFKDLYAEVQDHVSLDEPPEVSEHMTRLTVLISVLMEKILSAFMLEKKNPKDQYDCWELLRHSIDHLLANSDLAKEFPELSPLAYDAAHLEPLSRSLYSSPLQSSMGAKLLYLAEELRVTQNQELIPQTIEQGHALLRRALQFINKLVVPDQQLSLDCLDGLITQSFEPKEKRKQNDEEEDQSLIHSIDAALALMPSTQIAVGDPQEANPIHHLADAKRQLHLLQIRLRREGNVRNLYKIVNTAIPLAIESLSIARTTEQGLLDWSTTRRSELPHNLMEWCERLKFIEYTPEMKQYLYDSGKIHKYVRNPQLYQKSNPSSGILQELKQVNRHVTATLNPRETDWTLEKGSSQRLTQIINHSLINAQTGLEIFIKLAQRRPAQE